MPALREYVAYVRQGGSLDLQSYVTGIWSNGKAKPFSETDYSADDVYIWSEELDLNTPGIYTVTYGLYDYSGETVLTVVVEG